MGNANHWKQNMLCFDLIYPLWKLAELKAMGNSHLWKFKRTPSLSHSSQQRSHHGLAGLCSNRDHTGLCKCLGLWGEGALCGRDTVRQNYPNGLQTSCTWVLCHKAIPPPVGKTPLLHHSLQRRKPSTVQKPTNGSTICTQHRLGSRIYPECMGWNMQKTSCKTEGCVTAVGLPLAEHLFKGSE